MTEVATTVQWSGCALGVVGSYVLARNDGFSGWGFVAYLGSNCAWIAYSWAEGMPALMAQHLFFSLISVFGVWRWLVRPRVAHTLREQVSDDQSLTAAARRPD